MSATVRRIAGMAHGRGEASADACAPRCSSCRHRAEDRHSLEQCIPGLAVFSSGFGASVADSRLCHLHDQLVSPDDACARHEPAPRH